MAVSHGKSHHELTSHCCMFNATSLSVVFGVFSFLFLMTNVYVERAQFVKYFSVITITLQCTAAVLISRYVRTRAGDMFYSSTAVVLSEFLKLDDLLLVVLFDMGSPRAFCEHLHRYIFTQPLDNVKIAFRHLFTLYRRI